MTQVRLQVSLKAWSAQRSSSTVAKRRTHSRFSFRVRMNRSAQPLPSGSRTKAGELSTPRKRTSAWEVVAHVLTPVVVPEPEPGGDALAEGAEALAHRLPDRLERLEPVGAAAGMDADALGRAGIDRHEHGRLALAGHHRGQVGAPSMDGPRLASASVDIPHVNRLLPSIRPVG